MPKTKERAALAPDALRPYVKRALEDPELRDDLVAAFAAARTLYGELASKRGVKKKAEKISDRDFQKQLQELVAELTDASERLQGKGGKRSHKLRNRVVLLTGVTLGVLYNPWTGQATREWIMERIAGENGDGLDDLAESYVAETTTETVSEASADSGETEG